MPYYITDKHPDCKGWATVNGDYGLKGCHKTKQGAIDQMVAISQAEKVEPGGTHPRDRKKESIVSEAATLSVGDFVSWGSSGGTARGKISSIQRNGKINVPNSSFSIEGTSDNPAALIVVWQKSGNGWMASDTKVGHKFSTLTKIAVLNKPTMAKESIFTEAADNTYSPPAGVQNAAKRALKWISEGKAGGGFTSVGRRRASQLASGASVSRDTVARMKSYFARHGVDRKATGFNSGQEGYPSPGRVAWDAWGGTAGQAWVNRINLEDKNK